MSVRMIEGRHLTATDKRRIAATARYMADNGEEVAHCKTPRRHYAMRARDDGRYDVTISAARRDDFTGKQISDFLRFVVEVTA